MLNTQEYRTLSHLRNKLAHNQDVSYQEVLRYLDLIQREGYTGQQEIRQLMNQTRTYTIEDLAKKLSSKNEGSEKLLDAVVAVGLGALLGWALLEAFKKE